jgi:DNA-directed RNA polymerase specialized sigma24 family protein
MPDANPGPEWALFPGPESRAASAPDNELVDAACAAWPKALAHARKVSWRQGNEAEDATLATEVWESVLQSVSKSLQQINGRRREIANLEAYLLGTFCHRFGRAVRKEQRREKTIHLVSSVRELELLGATSHGVREHDIERTVHAKEIVQRMDAWSRKIWAAHDLCGYSWNEIGHVLGIPGLQVMRRFRHRMDILRARLTGAR